MRTATRTARRTIAGRIAALALAGTAAAGLGACTTTAPAPHPAASSPAAHSTRPASPAPPSPAGAHAAPASPAMTTAQQQAVDGARSYLDTGLGFSYRSLLDQLTSAAGSGFTQADAQFAIGHLHPDWNAQAVMAAKGYLQMGGFSRASLIDQLTSSAGNGFTSAQAAYAADQVGLAGTASPAAAPAPAGTAPPEAASTSADAVVTQYYQDITDGNYAAAWALGGRNIGGSSYAGWVAGYATTASVSLGTASDFGSDQVQAELTAQQDDGSVRNYTGTYTVRNGVIVAANITQQ